MDVLKAAKNHFKASLSGELYSLEVPQWTDESGKPITIYFRSSMRLSQKSIVLKHYMKEEFDKATASQIIFRARDKDGKPIFQMNQLDQLVDETDGEVLEWISKRMNEISPSIDEIQKN